MGERFTDHEGLRVEPTSLVEQPPEATPLVVISLQSVFVVDGVGETFVGDVEQGHARGLIDAAGFRLNNAIFDLVAHTEAVTTADGVGLQNEGDFIVVFLAIDGDGQALLEGDRHLLSIDLDVWVPELDTHDRVDGLDGDVQGFKFLGLVGGAPDVGVGGIGLFLGVAIRQVVGGKPGAHLVTATEFSDEVFVEPRLIDAQLRVGE